MPRLPAPIGRSAEAPATRVACRLPVPVVRRVVIAPGVALASVLLP